MTKNQPQTVRTLTKVNTSVNTHTQSYYSFSLKFTRHKTQIVKLQCQEFAYKTFLPAFEKIKVEQKTKRGQAHNVSKFLWTNQNKPPPHTTESRKWKHGSGRGW